MQHNTHLLLLEKIAPTPRRNEPTAEIKHETKGDSKASSPTQPAEQTITLLTSAPCFLFAKMPSDHLQAISNFLNDHDCHSMNLTRKPTHKALESKLAERKNYNNLCWDEIEPNLMFNYQDNLPSFFKQHFPNQINVRKFIVTLNIKEPVGTSHAGKKDHWQALCILTTEFKQDNISALELGFEKKLINDDLQRRKRYECDASIITPLTLTVCYGNLLGLKFLIEQRKQNPKNVEIYLYGLNYSLLHLAAANGHTHIIDYLILRCGMDINTRTNDHSNATSLMVAARHSQINTMQHLINEYKADLQQLNCCGLVNYEEFNLVQRAIYIENAELIKFYYSECRLSLFSHDHNHWASLKFIKSLSEERLAVCFSLNDERLTAELKQILENHSLTATFRP